MEVFSRVTIKSLLIIIVNINSIQCYWYIGKFERRNFTDDPTQSGNATLIKADSLIQCTLKCRIKSMNTFYSDKKQCFCVPNEDDHKKLYSKTNEEDTVDGILYEKWVVDKKSPVVTTIPKVSKYYDLIQKNFRSL